MKPQTLPATCELCGNWLPGHSVCNKLKKSIDQFFANFLKSSQSSCPRSGVPPSQWKDIQFYQDVEQLDAMDVNDQDEMLSINCLDQVGFNTD